MVKITVELFMAYDGRPVLRHAVDMGPSGHSVPANGREVERQDSFGLPMRDGEVNGLAARLSEWINERFLAEAAFAVADDVARRKCGK